ncbi:adenylate kinase [Candidatus Woesearchaeota archaeon CG10_big_fil_rev_8_21_14_0_10_37_12]|nr:MAG: adenylate kinase [Candidatus Woesearchaeota archaeon CG10_big_fil_rev_8_21_14_0_10_37_12]
MNIILIGPQGCGKGTQAKKIIEKYELKHLSTGDIIRSGIKAGDETALKIKGYTERGDLVPDDVIMELVEKNLDMKGNVFDGIPRTLNQAELLDRMTEIDFVIELKIDDEVAINRISGRRQDKEGNIYSIYNLPEGIKEENLIQREDDKQEAVKKRLELYRDETEPLLEYYKPRNIVHSINASKTPEKIFKDVCEIIDSSQ